MTVWIIFIGNYHPRELVSIHATRASALAAAKEGEDIEEWDVEP